MRRLLLVDDDESILEITRRALEREGYKVEVSTDGDEAIDRVRADPPDVLILDVMLPGRDGFELCREIRKFSELPIVLLTARTDTVDVVVGLESGADDYVTKPFDTKELIARIRSLLRRVGVSETIAVLRLGDLEIRPNEGVVAKSGKPVALTKTEFGILCALANEPRRLFSREQLLQDVWGYDYFGDARLVDVHIARLRSKVEDDPSDPALIQTVRGMGYKAVPP